MQYIIWPKAIDFNLYNQYLQFYFCLPQFPVCLRVLVYEVCSKDIGPYLFFFWKNMRARPITFGNF